MKYYKMTENGYIVLVGKDCGGIEIEKQEYDEIMEIIRNKPEVSEGFDYRLTENLEWEYFEVTEEETDEEATEADYQESLEKLGVVFDA